jgi:hypothetical protein
MTLGRTEMNSPAAVADRCDRAELVLVAEGDQNEGVCRDRNG